MSNGIGTPDEAPGDNETFANLDESLDDEDAYGAAFGRGHEGERDLDGELTVDMAELEEAGANLDDPERLSLIDGGMDDPDGAGAAPVLDEECGWDVDPCWDRAAESGGRGPYAGASSEVDADGDAVSEDSLFDVPDLPGDPQLDVVTVGDLDDIPDDAPGSDSAHW